MSHRTLRGDLPVHMPALADIARDDHPFVVIQKSAQVGATELLANLGLWAADTLYASRGVVFVGLPTGDQAADFVASRIDPAIQDNAYLRGRMQPDPPRRKGADSRRLKRIGDGFFHCRGTDSLRQVASVDADLVILDEYDQMIPGVLEAGMKRVASSAKGLIRIASTPRYPGGGVNELYLRSDRRRYHIPCQECGLVQPLTWDDNVDRDQYRVVCRECREQMEVLVEGEWIPDAPGNTEIRGYHLSRLYSPWVDIRAMVIASRATTPSALQEFYNSDLGEVFTPPGGGLTPDELDRCIADYSLDDYSGQECDMGIDVGLVLNVVIRENVLEFQKSQHDIGFYESERPPRLWFAGEVTWDDLDALMERFHVKQCVIDALPETTKATEFSRRHQGVRLAYYGLDKGRLERRGPTATEPATVHMDRTIAMDDTFDRFRDGSFLLPAEARLLGGLESVGLGEYYRQVLAPQRSLEKDARGNWQPRWLDHNRPDHYAHAEVYCRAAGRIAVTTAWAFTFG
jgi:hypothetical protein